MIQRVSRRGAAFIASEEGLVPAVYRDAVGELTWGIGHTRFAGAPDPRKMKRGMPSNVDAAIAEAMRLFDRDLTKYEADVVEAFGRDLKRHELDGLVSWHFNTGGAHSSRAVHLWRAGDKERAVAVIKKWNKGTIGGEKRVLTALTIRRGFEANMILNGVYPPSDDLTTPVWRVQPGSARVDWNRPIGRVPASEMLAGEQQADALDRGVGIFTVFSAVAAGVAVFWDKISNFIGGLF